MNVMTNSFSVKGSDVVPEATQYVKDLASRLYVQLHHCAPKSGATDEWVEQVKVVVQASHTCGDHVFRSIAETWQSSGGYSGTVQGPGTSNEPTQEQNDTLLLPPWTGLGAGVDRMVQLLHLLRSYVTTATAFPVQIPVGIILDLVTRILAAVPPQSSKWSAYEVVKPEISRQEREQLWTLLVDMHVASVELVSSLVQRLGMAGCSSCSLLLDQLEWTYGVGRYNQDVRASVYYAIAEILDLIGPSLDSASIQSLEDVIQGCCKDLMRTARSEDDTQYLGKEQTKTDVAKIVNSDTPSGKPAKQTVADTMNSPLLAAAQQLLLVLLGRLQVKNTPVLLRAAMERAAVLSSDTAAMAVASLNPGVTSILPILAQSDPQHPVVEAILRPRMPVVLQKSAVNGHAESVDGEVDMSVDEDSAAPEGELSWSAGAVQSSVFNRSKDNNQPKGQNGASATRPDLVAAHEESLASINTAQTSKRGPSDANEPSRAAKQQRVAVNPDPSDDLLSSLAKFAERVSPTASGSTQLESVTETRMAAPHVAQIPVTIHIAGQEPIVTAAQPGAGDGIGGQTAEEAGSDSDDDEDFEMPALVFKSDSDEDEDE